MKYCNNVLGILNVIATIVCLSCATNSATETRPVKIAFVINELSYRGMEGSSYEYAHYNEIFLGNKSIIINFDVDTYNAVRDKFTQRFDFFDCSSVQEMDYVLLQEDVDILYYQKPGFNDGVVSCVCKNVVHAVFPQPEQEKHVHGDVFAFISPWFLKRFPQLEALCVPYMLVPNTAEGDLREQLNIPQDALVFGRHGGYESFNVPCAHDAIKEVAQEHPEIYFLFLNTKKFCDLPNVIHLPKTTDKEYIGRFINSCDAMIHARWRGETFGLSIAEFSTKNKPVITWLGSKERAHIDFLGDKGIYYTTKQDLVDILRNFKKEPYKNWNVFGDRFTPEKVMEQFDKAFIQPFVADSSFHAARKNILSLDKDHAGQGISKSLIGQLIRLCNITDFVKTGTYWDGSFDEIAQEIDHLYTIETDHALAEHSRISCANSDKKTVLEGEPIDVLPAILSSQKESKKQKILFWFDVAWYLNSPHSKQDVVFILDELYAIERRGADGDVIVIDGIHLFDQQRAYMPALGLLYSAIEGMGYRIFVMGRALIALKDTSIMADPMVRSMTVSRLCDVNAYAEQTLLTDLLACERRIGRATDEEYAVLQNLVISNDSSILTRHYLLWYALALKERGEYEQAKKLFTTIINSGYKNWRIYWYLADTLYQMGDVGAEDLMGHVAQQIKDFIGVRRFAHTISR